MGRDSRESGRNHHESWVMMSYGHWTSPPRLFAVFCSEVSARQTDGFSSCWRFSPGCSAACNCQRDSCLQCLSRFTVIQCMSHLCASVCHFHPFSLTCSMTAEVSFIFLVDDIHHAYLHGNLASYDWWRLWHVLHNYPVHDRLLHGGRWVFEHVNVLPLGLWTYFWLRSSFRSPDTFQRPWLRQSGGQIERIWEKQIASAVGVPRS